MGEALETQDVSRLGGLRDAPRKFLGIGNRRKLDDEAVEIVVLVVELIVMMGLAVLDVVLDGKPHAEHDAGIDVAVGARHDLHRARQMPAHRRAGAVACRVVEQVALGQDDEVGAGHLVLEHLLDRVVMVNRLVGIALAQQRILVGGHFAGRQRRAVDNRHHAVHRYPVLHARPLEGLHQRLRQSQAGGLDEDMVDARLAGEDLVQRRHEIVGDGAADAAIRQFDNIVVGAVFDAAIAQDLAVDADIAEFVDDDRQALVARSFEQVADQRRLARAEKAGHHGAGNTIESLAHAADPVCARGKLALAGAPRLAGWERFSAAKPGKGTHGRSGRHAPEQRNSRKRRFVKSTLLARDTRRAVRTTDRRQVSWLSDRCPRRLPEAFVSVACGAG